MKLIKIILAILVSSCANSHSDKNVMPYDSSENQQLTIKTENTRYYHYKHNLYRNSSGQLAFRTIDYSNPHHPENKFLTTINTDTLNFEQKVTLNKVIDTATFVHAGDLYYKDKHHVYYHVQMSDGGPFFIVWQADPASFQNLDSSYYAKDKNHVFYRGSVLEGADINTFKVISKSGEIYEWTARDKHKVYIGEKVADMNRVGNR